MLSVGLAVGTILSVGLRKFNNGVKKVTKAVGDGVTELDTKLASILPALLGSIVSFVFSTAGKVISFLGKMMMMMRCRRSCLFG